MKKGTIRYMEPYDLVFTIISLNIFVFMSAPVTKKIMNFNEDEFVKMLAYRKQKNVEIIINQLKK